MTNKNIKRTCNICNQMMHGGIKGFIEHGENHHPDHYLSGAKSGHNIKFVEKNFFCPLDGSWYSSRQHMARTIKKYGWTNEKYYLTYGKEFLTDQWNKNEYDPILGNGRNHDKCLHCELPLN